MSPPSLQNSSNTSPHYESLPQYTPRSNDAVPPLYHYFYLPSNLNCHDVVICVFAFIFFTSTAFTLWPCEPDLSVVRLRVGNLDAHVVPRVVMNVTLVVDVRVRNEAVYSLVYDWLKVGVVYRGSTVGFVKSESGEVRARGFSYVNATIIFNAVDVLEDLVGLVEDIVRGVIPLETVTEVKGRLGFLFVYLPLKTKVSCDVDINTTGDHRIERQNCFPQ